MKRAFLELFGVLVLFPFQQKRVKVKVAKNFETKIVSNK